MKRYLACFLLLVFLTFLGCSVKKVSTTNNVSKTSTNTPAEDPWKNVPEILKQIKPPTFRNKDYVITSYGAVGDGKTMCTEAFRKAIDACNKEGGGRIVVPQGNFLTGAIHLKSNVDLHVMKGAKILFSTKPEDYLPLVYTRGEGVELMNYSPFIYAFEQK